VVEGETAGNGADGVEEFTFRVAGLVVVKSVPVGGARKVRQEEFVGTLFEMFPLP
jgi:hypothetical protein